MGLAESIGKDMFMYEGIIRLADLTVYIRAAHAFVFTLCEDYLVRGADPSLQDPSLQDPSFQDPSLADLTIEVSGEELEAEVKASPAGMDIGYLESICIYRKICRKLAPLGGMCFHAAVIEDGTCPGAVRGYAFTADSGTGKTTHVTLWQRAFGESIRVINGDKPILRRIDGKWYAYGTPWCGKEGWNINTRVPLCGICFLKRGRDNTICPMPASDVVGAVFSQLVLPEEPAAMAAALDLLDHLVREVPFYELHCTISEEAARVARGGMVGDTHA